MTSEFEVQAAAGCIAYHAIKGVMEDGFVDGTFLEHHEWYGTLAVQAYGADMVGTDAWLHEAPNRDSAFQQACDFVNEWIYEGHIYKRDVRRALDSARLIGGYERVEVGEIKVLSEANMHFIAWIEGSSLGIDWDFGRGTYALVRRDDSDIQQVGEHKWLLGAVMHLNQHVLA